METIKLAKVWDYITPMTTIVFHAGEHRVEPEIAAAALAAGVIEESESADNGNTGKTAKPRA